MAWALRFGRLRLGVSGIGVLGLEYWVWGFEGLA